MKETKPVRLIEGYSEQLWTSVAVKALRIGWPEGLRQAQKRLGAAKLRSVLTVQIFEDIFPTAEELPAVIDEARRLDYDAICARQTHHGIPGLTDAENNVYDQLETDRRWKYTQQARLVAEARRLGFYLESRAYGDFHCWLELMAGDDAFDVPSDNRYRTVDGSAWQGIPTACMDKHTPEARDVETFLSGTAAGHRNLARWVQAAGWDDVRQHTHASILPAPEQPITTPIARKPKQRTLFLDHEGATNMETPETPLPRMTDGRTRQQLKADGDDRWPDGTKYTPPPPSVDIVSSETMDALCRALTIGLRAVTRERDQLRNAVTAKDLAIKHLKTGQRQLADAVDEVAQALQILLADMQAEYRDKNGDVDHDGIDKAIRALNKLNTQELKAVMQAVAT